MRRLPVRLWSIALVAASLQITPTPTPAAAPQDFTAATFNLENYLDQAVGSRPAKPQESRDRIQAILLDLRADVLALQEIGSRSALDELRLRLRSSRLDYPFVEWTEGFDTNIHVAILSRLPIVDRRSHSNETYLLNGRRLRSSRGFAEVEIEAAPGYRFTLLSAHLKSQRESAVADQDAMREQEALLLRRKIDGILSTRPDANLIVLGDFNDVRDSLAIRTLIGRGRTALLDVRPAERNGDQAPSPNPRFDPRRITWTHHFAREDSYSRIDYILISRGMAREWLPQGTYVVASPDWGVASDHRPIVARFTATDR